jgi:type I restriction enzyme, S subunit
MRSVPYATYRKTDCDWLSVIPNHWSIKPLKIVASCNDEALPENTDPDYEFDYIDISSVSLFEGIKQRERTTFEKSPSRARRVVKRGDSIVSTVRTYLKAVATIDMDVKDVIVSTGFAVLRPGAELHQQYLGYFVQSQGFVDTVVARSTGVSYPAILATEIMTIPVTVPTMTEQSAIVAFLDRETAWIDGLVERKRRLLALLEEKRLAVITHAVTKGLNPQAPLRDSGIDGIGAVPISWDVVPLRRILDCSSGDFLTNSLFENDITDECVIPVVGGNGTMGYTTFSNSPSGTVVIGRVGAHCGNVHLVGEPCWVTDNALRVSWRKIVHPPYMKRLLDVMGLNRIANRNAQPLVTGSMIKDQIVASPSLQEQIAISAFLDTTELKIQQVATVERRAITLLLEYRAALITNAVTGKIDVRTRATAEAAA